MISYFDPSRPRLLNGQPCWLDAPHVALPRISILPSDESRIWRCEIMINGSYRVAAVPIELISRLLLDWQIDPEAALWLWWSTRPPTDILAAASEPTRQVARSDVNPADLGI